jgi:hypothetical protein
MALDDYTPCLPPEIWRVIFNLVTEIPGLLDVSPLPPLSDELRSFRYDHTLDRGRLMARHALPRVCRLWWNLAIEILYEYVYIRNPKLLPNAIEALHREVLTVS